jgi:hypothetical protein
LRPLDAGPLERAREIEAFGYLHMPIQQPVGIEFSTTIRVLCRRQAQTSDATDLARRRLTH